MITLTREEAQQVLDDIEAIAKADYRHWEELASLGHFERWARSRANHIAETLRSRFNECQAEREKFMNENKISIKQYEQAVDERVSLGGIKWEKKWDVCVQCDSREEADRVRAALAQPEPEKKKYTEESCPVCGYYCLGKGGVNCIDKPKLCGVNTAPPQSKWVGLTDEEAKKTFEKHNCIISADLAGILARAITAKLKEKNT